MNGELADLSYSTRPIANDRLVEGNSGDRRARPECQKLTLPPERGHDDQRLYQSTRASRRPLGGGPRQIEPAVIKDMFLSYAVRASFRLARFATGAVGLPTPR